MSSTNRGTADRGCRSREGEAGHQFSFQGNTSVTPTIDMVYTKLDGIATMAREDRGMRFRNLAHLLRPKLLSTSCSLLKKNAASGIDNVEAGDYRDNLDRNISDLHIRLKEQRYRATPVKRIYIAKDDGGERSLGLPVFEDKIVQRACVTILESIYENDFYHFSYGFRKGRNQHKALRAFRDSCNSNNVAWVVDMDIKGYFDAINHKQLIEFLELRIADKRMIQLIGKWLNVGIVEEGELLLSDEGVPQGGVISPLLANVYLHYVLDQWFEEQIKPVLHGKACMVRYADDSLVGFSSEADAKRFMKVLPKRFAKFGLEVHPKKTKLVRFNRPKAGRPKDRRNETFDFLGFTHYWGKTRSDCWVIKRKTSAKKLRSKMSLIWDWCKSCRHWNIKEQYEILCSKLIGHYRYYGVRCNMRSLEKYRMHVRRSWCHWLGKRHRNGYISWEDYAAKIEKYYVLPFPQIYHAI